MFVRTTRYNLALRTNVSPTIMLKFTPVHRRNYQVKTIRFSSNTFHVCSFWRWTGARCSSHNAIGSLLDAQEYLFCAQDEFSRRSTPFYESCSPTRFTRSLDLLLLFLFPSGRSRTSRLSLLHLFIGPLYYLQFGARSREGNFILVFCPVALRPPSHRFFTSAPSLSSSSSSFSSSSSSCLIFSYGSSASLANEPGYERAQLRLLCEPQVSWGDER